VKKPLRSAPAHLSEGLTGVASILMFCWSRMACSEIPSTPSSDTCAVHHIERLCAATGGKIWADGLGPIQEKGAVRGHPQQGLPMFQPGAGWRGSDGSIVGSTSSTLK